MPLTAPSSEGAYLNCLPLTREVAKAQLLTEGETDSTYRFIWRYTP